MNLLIVGAPGAGKGTMSELIIKNFGVTHISTGDILRQAIKDQTPVGKLAEGYIKKGELVPDDVIHNLIVDRLQQDDIKNGFLFDGYPRTLAQAIDLTEILKNLNKKIDAVINLNIADEELVKRVTGRRLCPSCGEIYNIYSKAPKVENTCDKCGATLTQRKDDNEQSLKVRLSEFHQQTQPVIEYYKKMNLVHDIDATIGIDNIFNQITSILAGLR